MFVFTYLYFVDTANDSLDVLTSFQIYKNYYDSHNNLVFFCDNI